MDRSGIGPTTATYTYEPYGAVTHSGTDNTGFSTLGACIWDAAVPGASEAAEFGAGKAATAVSFGDCMWKCK